MLRPSCAERLIAQDGWYASFSFCGSCAPRGTDSAGFLSVQRRQGQFFSDPCRHQCHSSEEEFEGSGFLTLQNSRHTTSSKLPLGRRKFSPFFYDLPTQVTHANPVDSSVAESAAAVTAIVSTSNAQDGSGMVLRGQHPANQGDASAVFAPLRLANRPALG